jgi:hypothetical protein
MQKGGVSSKNYGSQQGGRAGRALVFGLSLIGRLLDISPSYCHKKKKHFSALNIYGAIS